MVIRSTGSDEGGPGWRLDRGFSRLRSQGDRGQMVAAMTGGAVIGESAVMFLSYSRKDAKWRDKFLVMLAPDVREQLESD